MKGSALSLFDLSANPDPNARLTLLLDELCRRLELDYAAYAGVNTIDNSMHALVNYPQAWKQHYQDNALHMRDPTLLHSARSQAPVHWARLKDDPMFRPMFSQAHDFGIPGLGVTVPVRGPYGDKGMLSVTRQMQPQAWEKHVLHILPDLQQAAAQIHDLVMQQGVVMRAMRAPSLSLREKEILQWTAAGKTHGDIADILSISARTVEVHMRSARFKLGALTSAQAVARAIGMGLIYPM